MNIDEDEQSRLLTRYGWSQHDLYPSLLTLLVVYLTL